jgi:hypothetical protein
MTHRPRGDPKATAESGDGGRADCVMVLGLQRLDLSAVYDDVSESAQDATTVQELVDLCRTARRVPADT